MSTTLIQQRFRFINFVSFHSEHFNIPNIQDSRELLFEKLFTGDFSTNRKYFVLFPTTNKTTTLRETIKTMNKKKQKIKKKDLHFI